MISLSQVTHWLSALFAAAWVTVPWWIVAAIATLILCFLLAYLAWYRRTSCLLIAEAQNNLGGALARAASAESQLKQTQQLLVALSSEVSEVSEREDHSVAPVYTQATEPTPTLEPSEMGIIQATLRLARAEADRQVAAESAVASIFQPKLTQSRWGKGRLGKKYPRPPRSDSQSSGSGSEGGADML